MKVIFRRGGQVRSSRVEVISGGQERKSGEEVRRKARSGGNFCEEEVIRGVPEWRHKRWSEVRRELEEEVRRKTEWRYWSGEEVRRNDQKRRSGGRSREEVGRGGPEEGKQRR